ncbi:Calx-beta domain-containing protein [Leptolyngbya sp. 7M]|uniref:Calx-beta domain-containing protein n=1 Tax=Leptolyngbya sp. 7M TaxID=2812896 RepID=UPI001B8BACE5|nr:hypothetical protein [Leptolyngbya sp. 7M]QYO63263.1 hypothetical protein JVX88_25485 [Leptolyngbya sp. 7M]
MRLQGDVPEILRQFTAAQVRFRNPQDYTSSELLYRFDRPVVERGVTGGTLELLALESDLSSFTFTIKEPTATIKLPVLNDVLEEPDKTFTYTLVEGKGYKVNPAARSASFKLTDGVPAGVGPTVSFSATPTALNESEQTAVTLTFTLDSAPPPEGVVVFVDSGVPRALSEFAIVAGNPRNPEDTLNPTGLIVTGGRIVGTNEFASGFFFRILEQTATINVPVFGDGILEGAESFTFTLKNGETYQVDPGANSATVTIIDGAAAEAQPLVSLQTVTGAFGVDDKVLAPALVDGLVPFETGTSVLSLVLKAEGEIPSEGLVVTINTTVDLKDYFGRLGRVPFTPGGEIVEVLYNEQGRTTGLKFRMDAPNALINLNVADDGNLEGVRQATFTLDTGSTYQVKPGAVSSTVSFYDTIAQVPQPKVVPEVGFSVDKTELVEAGGTAVTLNFSLSEPPPAEGVLVYVLSPQRGVLGEFDVLNSKGKGGVFPPANFQSSGFYFKITEQNASITLGAFNDGEQEGIEELSFAIQPGPGYTVAKGKDAVKLLVSDTADSQIQVGLTTEPAVLIESEKTVSVHRFSLSATPPEGGLTVASLPIELHGF